MSHDLSLAQRHAFQLAQTLMVPVTVFRSNGAFGVLPSAELDDGEVETIAEFRSLRKPAGSLSRPSPSGDAACELRRQGKLAPLPRPCRPGSSRRPKGAPRGAGKGNQDKERRTQARAETPMERIELEELRQRVLCAAVLEKAGFAIDLQQSTRKAVKYRRGDAIVIVIHAGRGWFDPLSEAKGDVFSLVGHLDGVPFVEGLDRVASLIGYAPQSPTWLRAPRASEQVLSVVERWTRRCRPWPGSATWRYLHDERGLPDALIRAAVHADILREGPQGSMWAAHRDETGAITGWEERGPDWRGFSTGGTKRLFRFGPAGAPRLCVTEAAIDAMSLAGLEHARSDSLYLSTGGGWAPATDAAIRVLAAGAGALLVAATDNNRQGETYADRLTAMAVAIGCGFERLRPVQEDWNAELQAVSANGQEGKERRQEMLGCRMPAGRVKGEASPAARPLTQPDGEAAAGEGS